VQHTLSNKPHEELFHGHTALVPWVCPVLWDWATGDSSITGHTQDSLAGQQGNLCPSLLGCHHLMLDPWCNCRIVFGQKVKNVIIINFHYGYVRLWASWWIFWNKPGGNRRFTALRNSVTPRRSLQEGLVWRVTGGHRAGLPSVKFPGGEGNPTELQAENCLGNKGIPVGLC
jgi:hypothetical protein